MSPARTLGATKKRARSLEWPPSSFVSDDRGGVGSLYDPSILRLDVRLLDDGAELLGPGVVLKGSRLRLCAEGARWQLLAQTCRSKWTEHVRSVRAVQTSTCSAMASASSISIPRYLTVLSSLV